MYLGLIIDDQLKFKDHINYVKEKLLKFCSLFYRLRLIFTTKIAQLFREALENKPDRFNGDLVVSQIVTDCICTIPGRGFTPNPPLIIGD